MTRTTPFLISMLTILALGLLTPAHGARRGKRVALVPLSHSGAGSARVAWRATAQLAKRLRRQRGTRVVVLSNRRAARLAKCLQVAECTQAVSRKLRVGLLVAGHVTRLGRRSYRVDLRVVRADGEVLSADNFRTRTGKGSYGARLAARMLRRATQVRYAAASNRATDAQVSTRGPLFSRSEAESAANVVEARDAENPLTPPEEKPTEVAQVVGESAGVGAAFEPTVVRQRAEPGPQLFSRRYAHAWATLGAGLAAVGAGVGFGMIAKRASDAAQDAEYQKPALLNYDKARKNALVANVLYGVGGAAVATSVVLFLVERKQERREQRQRRDLSIDVQVAQGGAGVAVRGAF